MIKFIYNNIKNVNISYILLNLNYRYHFNVFYKKNINLQFKSKIVDKLLIKLLKTSIHLFQQLFLSSKISKKTYNTDIKFKSYTLNNKIWLNS